MRTAEPMTMATDFLLGLVSMVLGTRLLSAGLLEKQKSVVLWAIAILATALGAFLGGIYHGFPFAFGTNLNLLWTGVAWSLGLMGWAVVAGSSFACLPSRQVRWVILVASLKFLAFAWWATEHDEFAFVVADYLLSLTFVVALHARSRLRGSGEKASNHSIIAGVVVSLLAALLQDLGVGIHPIFNHNDLFHVIQIAAIWLFFRGARSQRDLIA